MNQVHMDIFRVARNCPAPDPFSTFKGFMQVEVPTIRNVSIEIPVIAFNLNVRNELYAAVNNPEVNSAVISLPVYVRSEQYRRTASGSLTFLKGLTDYDFFISKLKEKNYIIGGKSIFLPDGTPYLIPFYRMMFTDSDLPIATGLILKLDYRILSGTDMLDKYIRGKFNNLVFSSKDAYIPIPSMYPYRSTPVMRSTNKNGPDNYGYPTSNIQIVYEDLSKYVIHPAYPTPRDNDKAIHKMMVSKINEIFTFKE